MGIDSAYALADDDPAVQSALAAAWRTLAKFRVEVPQRNNLFAYFRSLDDVLTGVNEAGEIASVNAAMSHVDYLADKAGCSPAVILGGGHFAAEPQVILDALANINDVLQTSQKRTVSHADRIVVVGSDAVGTNAAVQSALTRAWKILSDFSSQVTGAPAGRSRKKPGAKGLCDFFKLLDHLLIATQKAGATEIADAVMTHVDYLADSAGCNAAVILRGGRFAADPGVIVDVLGNVGYDLWKASKSRVRRHGNWIRKMAADADPDVQSALVLARQTLSEFRAPVPSSGGLLGFFVSLNDLLTALEGLGEIERVEAVMSHLDYLSYKADCDSADILCGRHFIADPSIILEALGNIRTELQTVPPHLRAQPPAGVPEGVFARIVEAETTLPGWCSRQKALLLARAVLQERPGTCVEIGVFGGRSLVPCAAALCHIGAGSIYGVEPWSPDVAIEIATNEINDYWWSTMDFADVKRVFYRFVAAANLTQHVRLIEAPSGRAAALFDQIDFLHIDGSHSVVNAAEDVILYTRKVRSGGIVVFDDVNWQSTAPARALLGAFCDTVTVLKDPPTGLDICAVLRRR